MRLYIICHTSHKTNHLCLTTLFSQDAECNANSQSRQTGENFSGIALTYDNSLAFKFSFSRSALSVSRSLSANFSLSPSGIDYPTHFISPLCLSPFLFLLPSFALFLRPAIFSTLSHTHTLTHLIRLTVCPCGDNREYSVVTYNNMCPITWCYQPLVRAKPWSFVSLLSRLWAITGSDGRHATQLATLTSSTFPRPV